MTFQDLPLDIQVLITVRAKEQRGIGYEPRSDDEVDEILTWESTPEGHEFWNSISKGDFSPYYKQYSEE